MPGLSLHFIRHSAGRIPGLLSFARRVRLLFEPDRRAVVHLRQRRDLALFQPWPTTLADRYPALFDALDVRLRSVPEPRVLSFGCSSGEEVRALRQRLPNAWITGIDANPRAIAKARRADRNPRSTYVIADRPDPAQRYDAVLALAVLRHGSLGQEPPASCAGVLPFARVAEGVARLDAVVEPGGWLAVAHSNFLFADMPCAAAYVAEEDRFDVVGTSPLYGPDDRLVALTGSPPVLFRKAGGLPA